jgi:serine/threonine protein kinase
VATIKLQNEADARAGRYYEFDPERSPVLGQGGMGVVFKGKIHNETGKPDFVAIKVLFRDLPLDSIARAQREAGIQIVHENVVRMYGFVEIADFDGKPKYHVISEYLDGETLDKVLERKGALPPEEAIRIVKSILAALYMLHSKGYIHRDIDPSNVMLCKDGKVKLIDFGIAKLKKEYRGEDVIRTGTMEGAFIGKINYASPEQLEGKHELTNETSDVYSTGILLYELLTGQLPFTGYIHEIIKAHQTLPIPRNNSISGNLQYVIRKATAKAQSARYQSVTQFTVDLEKIEKGEKLGSSPIKKWMLAPAGVLLILLAGFGIWRYQADKQSRFRETIEKASSLASVALYQDALDAYRKANQVIRTDSITRTINMLDILTRAVAEYTRSEYLKADSLFKLAEELSSSDACYYLGEMNYEGTGTPKNFRKGFEYTSKAASMGNKLAEYRLGYIYLNGIDVVPDYDKAIRYFERSGKIIDMGAEANNPELQFVKGEMYLYGNGVPQNTNRAMEYYESAAKQDYPRAQYALYELLNRENPQKAMEWLALAAEKGYPKAAFRLGAWLIGQQKYREGYEWTLKAAEKNYSPAFRQLGAIYQEKRKNRLSLAIQQAINLKGNDSVSHQYTLKALDYDFDNYLAMYDIGMDYLEGNGVDRNKHEARKYFEMARQKVEQLPYRENGGKRIYDELRYPFAERVRTFNYAQHIK